MEVSALKYSGGIGLHGRPPLLRLQSDERLVALVRRGSTASFEALVSRYESRLLAFCRHLLGSREDAEDVLQEVFAAAFNAMLADERPINVRPWLYRIARNRSLNHLRRAQTLASDTMDVHLSDNGATTADVVHDREEFRLLVGDIQELPETQRTALVLREMDALSYEQIAETMETTVPSVKSLLVRARVSLAEAAQARLLTCEEVRVELGEVAEGLRRKPTVLVRRHVRACDRCSTFRLQLKETNKALGAMLPISTIVVLKKFLITHLSHSAGSGATAGAGAAGSSAAAGSLVAGSTSGGLISAGLGTLATKAAAGLAAAALVTAGAVEVEHATSSRSRSHAYALRTVPQLTPVINSSQSHHHQHAVRASTPPAQTHKNATSVAKPAHRVDHHVKSHPKTTTPAVQHHVKVHKPAVKPAPKPRPLEPGRTQVQNDPTIVAGGSNGPGSGPGTPTDPGSNATAPESSTRGTTPGSSDSATP
jgi:RNA polymerase sigma factor (sigma-70 family)